MLRTTLLLSALVVLGTAAGCDKQTATGKTGTALTVYKPMNETIKPGDRGEVDVRVNRDDFDGPLTVLVTDLPAGVRVTNSTMTIPKDDSKLTLQLAADPTAAIVKDHVVNVRVTGADGLTAYESFKVSVDNP